MSAHSETFSKFREARACSRSICPAHDIYRPTHRPVYYRRKGKTAVTICRRARMQLRGNGTHANAFGSGAIPSVPEFEKAEEAVYVWRNAHTHGITCHSGIPNFTTDESMPSRNFCVKRRKGRRTRSTARTTGPISIYRLRTISAKNRSYRQSAVVDDIDRVFLPGIAGRICQRRFPLWAWRPTTSRSRYRRPWRDPVPYLIIRQPRHSIVSPALHGGNLPSGRYSDRRARFCPRIGSL
jgi:hypothetical protein